MKKILFFVLFSFSTLSAGLINAIALTVNNEPITLVDIDNKRLIKLNEASFTKLGLKERFDIQEWIEKTPSILGENLLIIAKEYQLPSKTRLDLLAVDKKANLVIIELKRDNSGSSVDWQAIKYCSYCSNFTHEEICQIYAEYSAIQRTTKPTFIKGTSQPLPS